MMADTLTPAVQPEQQRWADEVTAAEKELEKFHKRGDSVTKRFLDERETLNAGQKWFNIFYANTNILESALYSQLPKPSVNRRFKDFDDPVARVAGIMLQRSITQDLDDPRDTFDSTLRSCVQDRLVPGLSMAWLRLETDTEEIEAEEVTEPQPGMEVEGDDADEVAEPMQKITDQRVCVDYVFWKDFLFSPCRVWDERRWVGRKVYMDKPAATKRFGEAKANLLTYIEQSPQLKNSEGSTPKWDAIKKACIIEIWERATRKVFWFNKDCTDLLDVKDDPLQLVGFEPCPKPMLANVSTSNATPRPDFYMIQDQYNELDNINNRISNLVQACKVIGVYDKAATGIDRMLTEGFDNQLIPVDNWAMFAEKGGLKGQIDWLPLDAIVTALAQLNQAREVIKGQIYELTGIADIVRGASKASETLGAQQIKAQFASVRIKKLQDEVARFASDIMRIKAEIMCKHFDPEILVRISNMANTPDRDLIPQALEMLKDPNGFEWRIQVTADSIAQADYAMEKQDRIEFLTAVSGYLEKASAMFQAVPGSATLLVGMLKWAVAGFRNAAEIEGMIDKELDAITKNPPQDKPDPEAEKLKAEQQMEQQRLAAEQQAAEQEAQREERKVQVEIALEQQRAQMEMAMEQQRLEMEFRAEQQRMDMEQRMNEMKLMFEQMMNQIKLGAAQAQSEQKLADQAAAAKLKKESTSEQE
jgi:hypothetical protein